jgi:hypothetical protein
MPAPIDCAQRGQHRVWIFRSSNGYSVGKIGFGFSFVESTFLWINMSLSTAMINDLLQIQPGI